MLRFCVSVLAFLMVGLPLAAQDSPREKLSILAGDWTIEGRENSYRETCEWFTGRSHLVCNSESQGKKGLRRGVSVFSYSEELGRFLYYHYGSSGVAVAQDVFVTGEGLFATSERVAGGVLVRAQVRMTRRADGSFDFVEEESTDGGPWVKTVQIRYVRRTAPE